MPSREQSVPEGMTTAAAARQVVVLFQILAAEINFGYKFQTAQCVSFNSVDLRNIRQLAELVRAAMIVYVHRCSRRYLIA